MSTERHIRAVSDGERPPKTEVPLSLDQAVATGDYLTILIAQRFEIAQAIPLEKGPAKAALHRQLSIVAKEIEAIEAANSSRQESESNEEVTDGEYDEAAV